MRRMLLTTAAIAVATLTAPGAALAHDGEHRQGAENHANRGHDHARHHRHAHLLAFHAQATPGSSSATTPSTSAGDETAATIASFTGGVLTLTLKDGSTVSAKVTEGTEIECPAASASAARNGDCPGHDGRGDDGRGDDGNASEAGEHCTSAALIPGANVHEALLSVGSSGSTWVKVEL